MEDFRKKVRPMMEDEKDDGNTSGDAEITAPDGLRPHAAMRGYDA
jgi:hypothetical protein